MSFVYLFAYIVLFLFGISIGSFLNVVIDRLPKRKPIGKSRSICPNCEKVLAWYDLVPLVSFISLGGKCRYCKKSIDPLLPIVEGVCGGAFVLAGLLGLGGVGGIGSLNVPNVTSFIKFIYLLIIFSVFVVIFFMDLKYKIIDDRIIVIGIISSLLYLILNGAFALYNDYTILSSDSFGKYLLKAGFLQKDLVYILKDFGLTLFLSFIIFLFFYFLILVTKGKGIGGADVKLAFLVGLFAGFPNALVSIFISFLTGALAGIILILVHRKSIKSRVAFGPFMVLGAILGYVFGGYVIRWYIGTF